MTRTLRFPALYALFTLLALSTFAQSSPLVGTVVDVDASRGRIMLELDDSANTRITIETDSVATSYKGFGTVIAGKPEVFVGSKGLANVRVGDRIDVRGPRRNDNLYRADQVTLLGRPVAASQVGIGQTREPSTPSTPTDNRATAANPGIIEGTIRQMNDAEGRLVVQTSDRRMINVRTYRTTPVYYRGEAYRVTNLEVGDRIRIETDNRDTNAQDVSARRIDVTMSVQDSGTVPGTATGGNVTILEGRVTRVEPGLDYIYVDDTRKEVRVDMREAQDPQGDVVRARDVRVGDNVEINGSFNRVGDMFLASTVRFGTGGSTNPGPIDNRGPIVRPALMTMTGTITETLEDGPTIGFRDRDTNEVVRVWAAPAFVVRTKGTTYTTAEQLRVNDTAVIDAYRDADGNLIAQTIRLRNR
jgi:hypothetical protein